MSNHKKVKQYEKALNIALPIVSVLAIIGIWAIAAAASNNALVLPTVSQTLSATFKLFARGEFYRALFGTLLRSLLAFLFCFIAAFLTAFVSYKYRLAERALSPVIVIIRVLPTIAVVLILVLWTSSRVAAIIVTSLVIFPTLHENLYSSFKKVDGDILEMCSVFKVSKKRTVTKVIIPSVAPDFISAIGSGLTLGLKLIVAAEVLAHTPASMGYMLNTAQTYFEIAEMMALVLITVILGLIIGLVFNTISERMRKK